MPKVISQVELAVRRLVPTGVLVLAAIAMAPLPSEAQTQGERWPCIARGHVIFEYEESVNGSGRSRSSRAIEIQRADIEVVARNKFVRAQSDIDMREICAQAALCLAQVAAGAETCVGSTQDVLFETIRKPDDVREWRRRVACNQAREGNVADLRPTNTNTVTLVRTWINGTLERYLHVAGAAEVNESGHVCWAAPPQRTDPDRRPSRTDASHQPSRTNPADGPSRTNPPSPITTIMVTVTPPEQKGKCPASVLMQARLELREPTAVRWWVTGENGYESPKSVRSFTKPEATLIWRRHIDPKPTTGGVTQKPGGKPNAPIHRGFFQLHFETASDEGRAIPLGRSDRVPFTVDCNLADRFKR